MKRFLWPAVLGSIALVTMGHAVVSPRDSRPGAYERYVLRVPNESDVPTTRVEMTFPANVRVISFVDVPGWQLTAVMDTNSGRAISAVWTGSLPPARFVELPFMGVNPDSATRIVWPVKQTYANGEVVEWSGPEGSNRPASVTVVGTTPRPASTRTWLSVVGIALSVIAIVLALRSRQGRNCNSTLTRKEQERANEKLQDFWVGSFSVSCRFSVAVSCPFRVERLLMFGRRDQEQSDAERAKEKLQDSWLVHRQSPAVSQL